MKFIPKEEWLDVGLSPLAEGRELKWLSNNRKNKGRFSSPLAEGRELKYKYL